MKRWWISVAAVFALVSGGITTLSISNDRIETLKNVEARNSSLARLITAHADSSLEDANIVLASLAALVEPWDLRNEEQGRAIHDHLRALMRDSARLSSAWVTDSAGNSVLDSWSFPSRQLDASKRDYFKAHMLHAPEPIVSGTPEIGPISARSRFTFSRSLRNSDGSLRAVLVVGIFGESFEAIYDEVTSWDGARAVLAVEGGGVLARIHASTLPTQEYLSGLQEAMATNRGGAARLRDGDDVRLTSWQRSERYRQIYSTVSQDQSIALQGWRVRSMTIGTASFLACLAFFGWTLFVSRATELSNRLLLNELASREVHHRVKNSLQILASILGLRARSSSDPAVRHALEEVRDQVIAIGDAHRLLQSSPDLARINLREVIVAMCERTPHDQDLKVSVDEGSPIELDANGAATIAIVVNELVTNAVKHAQSRVEVACVPVNGCVFITVADDGPGLPDGFSVEATTRFGLRTVAMMVKSLGGKIEASNGAAGGARFVITIPLDTGRADRTRPQRTRHGKLREENKRAQSAHTLGFL